MADVQILLSETNSLPETTLSVDTSLPAAEDQASLSDQAWDEYQAELISTCQTNLCLLKKIAAAKRELESVLKEDVLKLQDLINEWESLQTKVLALSRGQQSKSNLNNLEVGTVDVRTSLDTLEERLVSMEEKAREALDTAVTKSLEKIDANICDLQSGLSQLQEMEEQVLSVSSKILRLISKADLLPSLPPLWESATQLYQQWEDVYELNCTQLTKLQTLKSGWGKSIEEDISEDLETTVQCQPVQVGNNLPMAEVAREALHLNTAAEVQLSDCRDLLLDLEDNFSGKKPQRAHVGEEKMTLNTHTKSVSIKKDNGSVFSFWRLLRISFPIQLILLILYCLSFYTEPQCCEKINNYDFSMMIQLRHPNGPPPV